MKTDPAEQKAQQEMNEVAKAAEHQQILQEQRTLYAQAIRDLKSGEITPEDARQICSQPLPSSEEIAKMSKREHELLDSIVSLREQLSVERQKLETKAMDIEIAKEILAERGDLGKLEEQMTESEKAEFEKRRMGQ